MQLLRVRLRGLRSSLSDAPRIPTTPGLYASGGKRPMAAAGNPRSIRRPKKLGWDFTTLWKVTCPRCGEEFGPEEFRCPIDKSQVVVRQERNEGCAAFFTPLIAVGRQELRCSANDGYFATSIPCPRCGSTVRSAYIVSGNDLPRPILYVPFVFLPTFIIVVPITVATFGLGIILWPLSAWFLGMIYMLLFDHLPRPIRSLFLHIAWHSFYDTNEAGALKS